MFLLPSSLGGGKIKKTGQTALGSTAWLKIQEGLMELKKTELFKHHPLLVVFRSVFFCLKLSRHFLAGIDGGLYPPR